MKLMELRGLLRKPGNPTMVVDLGNGVPMSIAFQKTPLLEELGKAFNDERTAETGLSYDPETNLMTVDGFVGASEPDAETEGGDWEDDGHGTPPAREPDLDLDLDDEPMSPVAERDPADDEDDDLL